MSRCKACNKQFSDSEEVAEHRTPCGRLIPREECAKCYRVAMQAAHGGDWNDDDTTADFLSELGIDPFTLENIQPE